MIRFLSITLISCQTFAVTAIPTIPAPTPRYLVEVQLKRDAQVDTSRIILNEGEDGAILSNAGPHNKSSFSAIVHQTGEDEINLSYRVKQQRAESHLDFARADIALRPNLPLVVTAQDDQGDEVEIRVSVTKQ